MKGWSDEETDNLPRGPPLLLQGREVDQERSKVDHMLYAGSNLDKARDVFAKAIKHRPRIRLTIRQRTRVLEQWPRQVYMRPYRFAEESFDPLSPWRRHSCDKVTRPRPECGCTK